MNMASKLKQWENQQVWYIDAINGNDSRSGLTPRKALKTFREYLDRTSSDGFREYTHRVDIYILNDLPPEDPLHIHGVTTKNGFLYIHGTQRISGSGHLSNVSATDVNVGEQATILDMTRNFWDVGSLIYIPAKNAYAIVIADLGEGKARITDPTHIVDILSDQAFMPMIVTLAADDEYKIIERTKVTHSGLIDISGGGDGGNSVFGFNFILEDIKIVGLDNKHRFSRLFLSGQFNVFCRVNFHKLVPMIDGTPMFYQSCFMDGTETAVRTGSILQLGSSAFINNPLSLYGPFSRIGGCVFQNSNVYKLTHNGQIWAVGRTGFFDTSVGKAAIWLKGGTLVVGGEGIFGTGNTIPGVILEGNATLKYSHKSQLKLSGIPELRIGGINPKFNAATPPLENHAGATIPQQSPCSTWEELAAEPFHGEAANYSKGAFVMKDE